MARYEFPSSQSTIRRPSACYASAIIAAVSSIALVSFGGELSPRELAWLIYGYLGIFGFNLIALFSRMLFAERDLLKTTHLQPRVADGV